MSERERASDGGGRRDRAAAVDREEPPDMGDLYDDLQELADTVDDPEEREKVEAAMRTAVEVEPANVFGRVIRGFDRGDAAEALLGATVFGIPMLVEGGTNEAGEFLHGHPLALVGTVAFTITTVIGILYVSEIQDVHITHAILGVVPRRLVGVLGISLAFAFASMTAWGRISWAAPELALASIVVAWMPMAIGAALGDILPGT
jgi:uncharacterized membrane protein